MKFDGAVIKEQGVTFALVSVKPHALQPGRREQAAESFAALFPGLPVVLVAVSGGRGRFWGRADLVRFLAKVPLHAIPWRTYTA